MPSVCVSQGGQQQLCSRSTDDCSHAPTGRMAAQWPSAPKSPQALLPLREQAGPKELVNIHVPFSLSDLSQITHQLGSFSVDPQNYIRQFEFITNCYDLHFKDVYGILNTSLSSQERNQLWQAAQKEADHRHEVNTAGNDPGPIAVPEQDKHTNYNKLLKQVQEANKNPAVFLNWLSNPRTLQAVPALLTVSGRLPAPPPCAVPAPPSPMRRRHHRRHLTRFGGSPSPPLHATSQRLPHLLGVLCCSVAKQQLSGSAQACFFTIQLCSKDAFFFLLQFSNHLIKVIGHLIILPALFINQSLHHSPV
ncbi:uncharacterized protein LOC106028372 [Cavia porcellus]|uniref:uncharacterized protein LOC106028372 n=1 Tax=Cavia porcellus TaxID=10141 RepID=UPI002FDFE3C2